MLHTGVMTRTDIHRPSAPEFDPETYTVFGFADFHETDGSRPVQEISRLVGEGWSFRGAPHGSGQCSHCGARLRYAALMGHEATKTLLYVGETCLDNRFDLTKGEFQAMRKAGMLNAERRNKAEKIEALLAQYPHLAYASYAHNIGAAGSREVWGGYVADGSKQMEATFASHEEANAAGAIQVGFYGYRGGWDEQTVQGRNIYTLDSIWERVARYGDCSEKAAAHVDRVLGWLTDAEVKRAARDAVKDEMLAAGVEVPAGRVVVEGTITSKKWKSNDFGGAWKVVVQHTDGWKVWGTLPAAIEDAEVDTKVRFTATVEPKPGDPTFGFYKRPAKAEVL